MSQTQLKYCLLFFCLCGGLSLTAGANAAPVQLPAAYQILLHKSIFSRNRISYSRKSHAARTVPPSRPTAPIFIGALRNGGNIMALIESPGDGSITAVHVHSIVPGAFGGLITQITLHNLKIIPRGSPPRIVMVGQNLMGASAGMLPSTTSAAAPVTGSSNQAVSPAQASIIEMLRKQREKENK